MNYKIHSQHCALEWFFLWFMCLQILWQHDNVSALNIVTDALLHTNSTANQSISAVPCVQNHTHTHTQIYIKNYHHKIISKCVSPQVHKLHQFQRQWHPLHYECSHLFLLWWYQSSVLKLYTQITTNTQHSPYALSTQTNYTNTQLIPQCNL